MRRALRERPRIVAAQALLVLALLGAGVLVGTLLDGSGSNASPQSDAALERARSNATSARQDLRRARDEAGRLRGDLARSRHQATRLRRDSRRLRQTLRRTRRALAQARQGG